MRNPSSTHAHVRRLVFALLTAALLNGHFNAPWKRPGDVGDGDGDGDGDDFVIGDVIDTAARAPLYAGVNAGVGIGVGDGSGIVTGVGSVGVDALKLLDVLTDEDGENNFLKCDRNNANCLLIEGVALSKTLNVTDDSAVTGPIPADIGLLTHLTGLRLHGLGLTGELPDQLGLLVGLLSLSIKENRALAPVIPSSFAKLTSLTRLALDENGGSLAPSDRGFSIPEEIGEVRMRVARACS
jgi:hypothetical protein